MTEKQLAALRAVPMTAQTPNRLRVAIALAVVKQGDVAEAVGLTPAHFSTIVSGRTADIGRASAQAIANYFGCLIEDLFPPQVAA